MTPATVARHARAAAAQPPRLGPLRRALRETGLALITLGVITLLFVAYQLFGTNLTEEHNQAQLKRGFQHTLLQHPALPTVPPSAGHPIAPGISTDAPTLGSVPAVGAPEGEAIDHMVIPKLGLDKYVVDGTTESALTRGPGHYANTPYPGQQGNVGIAGHRTTYGAPFYNLDRLGVGDDIYLTDTAGHRYVYQVDQPAMIVAPSDVAVLGPTPDAELTLTTCNPRLSATNRLIVKAKLVGSPAAATTPSTPSSPSSPRSLSSPSTPATPATPTTPVPRSPRQVASAPSATAPSDLTAGNGSAWPPALLYAAAVVLLWIATRVAINRTRKWRRALACLAGIGVCSVPLWFSFENIVRLLPQSI